MIPTWPWFIDYEAFKVPPDLFLIPTSVPNFFNKPTNQHGNLDLVSAFKVPLDFL